ncbi:MAG: hypothetical protein K9M15_02250 [Candidatus Marinimicrobia bacterium]|nr:hypothetical protein [Candidatus Neomarinimicrobiota bacterium]
MKKVFILFFLGFVFNFVWENAHACLYVHYQGSVITQLILLRAALFDATFITIVGFIFLKFNWLKKRAWMAIIVGIVFAVFLEIFALKTGRWEYNNFMPIIPFINIGLTPTIQLGLLSFIILKIYEKITQKQR